MQLALYATCKLHLHALDPSLFVKFNRKQGREGHTSNTRDTEPDKRHKPDKRKEGGAARGGGENRQRQDSGETRQDESHTKVKKEEGTARGSA